MYLMDVGGSGGSDLETLYYHMPIPSTNSITATRAALVCGTLELMWFLAQTYVPAHQCERTLTSPALV